jgi:hypothetical protein
MRQVSTIPVTALYDRAPLPVLRILTLARYDLSLMEFSARLLSGRAAGTLR